MKKVVFSLLSIFLLICGCNDTNKNNKELKIIAPSGAPSIAFYKYINDDNFITNSLPSNIQASMVNGEYDVAILDVVGGINIINKGASYLLTSVITFGNFYLLSLGNDENETIDEEDIIVSFGQNTTPDLIYKSLFPDISIDYYVNGVSEASSVAISGLIDNKTVNYVFIAQPVMQKVLQTNENTFIYADIKELFEEKYQTDGIPQAGVFIKKSLIESNKEDITNFLSSLKDDIDNVTINPDLLLDLDNSKFSEKIGIPTELANQVLKNNNGINLGFKDASSYLDDLNIYFEILGLNEIKEDVIMK